MIYLAAVLVVAVPVAALIHVCLFYSHQPRVGVSIEPPIREPLQPADKHRVIYGGTK